MSYAIDALIAELKAARSRSGMSQRELSAKVGVPQSHISKIENGGADIRLSSLVELARALELEPVLIPRHLVPAVEGFLRSREPLRRAPRSEYKELTRATKVLGRIARRRPNIEQLDRLVQILRELGQLSLSHGDLATIERAARALADADSRDDIDSFAEIRNALRNLRNRVVHAVAPQQPAYSLEDDDDA